MISKWVSSLFAALCIAISAPVLCLGDPPVTVEFGFDPRERGKMEGWPQNMPGSEEFRLYYSRRRKEDQSESFDIDFSMSRKYLTDPLSTKLTYYRFDGCALNVQEGERFTLINADVHVISLAKKNKPLTCLEILREGAALALQDNIGNGFYLCEHSGLTDSKHTFVLGEMKRDCAGQYVVALSHYKDHVAPPKESSVKIGDVISMAKYELIVSDIKPGDTETRKRGTIALEPVLPLATRLPELPLIKPDQK